MRCPRLSAAALGAILLLSHAARGADTPDRSGDCICDLTAVACDANCCCDPDCDAHPGIVHLGFTKCKPEKYGSRRGVLCKQAESAALEPYFVNEYRNIEAVVNTEEEYYSRRVYNTKMDAERSQVCIVYDNVEMDDASFAELEAPLSLTDLSLIETSSPSRNVWAFQRDGRPQARRTANGWYRAGDRVVGVNTVEERALPWLVLPKDINGRCSDRTPVFFLKNVFPGEERCTRVGPIADVCKAVPIQKWLHLALGTQPYGELSPAELVASAAAAEVTVVSWADGQPSEARGTVLFDGICKDAVRRVEMEIVYSMRDLSEGEADALRADPANLPDARGVFRVSAFRVKISVGDITQADVPLVQEHAVAWIPAGTAGGATPSRRAGNPGYRRGAAIQTLAAPTAEGGAPPATKPFALPMGVDCAAAQGKPLKFLYDVMSSGCVVNLNLVQFRDACVRRSSFLVDTYGPATGVTNATTVATYGNSDPAAADDWVGVKARTDNPEGVGIYDPAFRRCTFLVGYDYTFVLRRIGKVYNPQDIIAGVIRTGVYSTWTFTQDNPDTAQRFLLRWRASFVRQGDVDVNRDAIEPPPLLPVVSDDIFYPFRMIGGGDTTPVTDGEL